MKTNKLLATSLILCLTGYSASTLADVKVSTGYLYVNGQSTDLNLSNIKLTAIPLSLKVKKQALGVKLSTSYLNLDAGTGITEKGQGDTRLKVSYDVTPKWTVSVQEKFSTGDKAKGLSTGYNDTKFAIDYSAPLSGGKSVFGSLAQNIKGGKNNNPTYKNSADLSIGMSKVLPNNWVTGASLNYTEASSTALKNTTGGLAFLGHKINKNWNTNAFAGYDSSKTTSIGVSISYKY